MFNIPSTMLFLLLCGTLSPSILGYHHPSQTFFTYSSSLSSQVHSFHTAQSNPKDHGTHTLEDSQPETSYGAHTYEDGQPRGNDHVSQYVWQTPWSEHGWIANAGSEPNSGQNTDGESHGNGQDYKSGGGRREMFFAFNLTTNPKQESNRSPQELVTNENHNSKPPFPDDISDDDETYSKNKGSAGQPSSGDAFPVTQAEVVPNLGLLFAPSTQWHVGIYAKTFTPYMQVCGGTLVKADVVLSAAHCFWNDAVGALRPGLFAVAAGKVFRSWVNEKEVHAQRSDIKDIKIPPRFRGAKTSFQDDIAILLLTRALEYGPGVMPACVTFDPDSERSHLSRGELGIFAGWGLTTPNGSPSKRLNFLFLPYVEIEECLRTADESFLKFITSDKICAGDRLSGRALCRGDSGGGLIYFSGYVAYLYGIASTAPRDANECNAHAIASFTNLLAHKQFLLQYVPGIDDDCYKLYVNGSETKLNDANKGLIPLPPTSWYAPQAYLIPNNSTGQELADRIRTRQDSIEDEGLPNVTRSLSLAYKRNRTEQRDIPITESNLTDKENGTEQTDIPVTQSNLTDLQKDTERLADIPITESNLTDKENGTEQTDIPVTQSNRTDLQKDTERLADIPITESNLTDRENGTEQTDIPVTQSNLTDLQKDTERLADINITESILIARQNGTEHTDILITETKRYEEAMQMIEELKTKHKEALKIIEDLERRNKEILEINEESKRKNEESKETNEEIVMNVKSGEKSVARVQLDSARTFVCNCYCNK